MMNIDEILCRLKNVKRSTSKPNSWMASCPAHTDNNPSLSITIADNGRKLFHCFAGCTHDEILAALGEQMHNTTQSTSERKHSRPVEVYRYRDENNNVLYAVERYDAPKKFLQKRISENGQWKYKLNGVRRVLYHLPELLNSPPSDTVFIVEGEKDVDRLISEGLIATCNLGGEGMGWQDDYSPTLEGRSVCIIPDNDLSGRKHASKIAESLCRHVKDIRILELPNLPPKGDVSDWLNNGGTVAILEQLAANTPLFNNEAATDTPKTIHPLTDIGNAERFVEQHGENVYYCKALGGFMIWDGRRYARDTTKEVEKMAHQIIRSIPGEASQLPQGDTRYEKILKHAAKSENDTRIKAMLQRLQALISVNADFFDPPATPWLLNVQNGIINLRSGEFLPHDRKYRITKITPIMFDEKAQCPNWWEFLKTIFDNDFELMDFVQRAVGYSLLGLIDERALFILWGTGRNGKSVFIDVIMNIFGEYGASTPVQTFMSRDAGASTNDIARLAGVRLATASETDSQHRLSPSTIKQMTGGDVISARFLYREFFQYLPQFTPWLVTNNKPMVPDGGDQALWDRMLFIPFNVRIPDDQMIPRPQLMEQLTAELPGILNWALTGLRHYLRIDDETGKQFGLQPPQVVMAATEEYRSEQDALGDFITDECELDTTFEETAIALYKRYGEWCLDNGSKKLTNVQFGRYLSNHPGIRKRKSNGRMVYSGIGLNINL
jgi:putative DNA primase/helicase